MKKLRMKDAVDYRMNIVLTISHMYDWPVLV